MASGAGWAVTPRALPVAMDQMGRDARLALLASRQAGAFTFQQALTIGYPRATISRRITSGTWEKKHPGVYVIGGTAPSRLLDLWAGVLAVGSDGVLSHESSALIHGAERLPEHPIVITSPHGMHNRLVGVFVHQIDDLVDRKSTRLNRLPVSKPRSEEHTSELQSLMRNSYAVFCL